MTVYNIVTDTIGELFVGDVINCPYSGADKSISLKKGTYKIETWGAVGGSYSSSAVGGNGGYSVGNITTNAPYVFFMLSGGKNGFNGGGSFIRYGGSGGGGSDIRIGQNSIFARVIVSGGGGGGGWYGGSSGTGGGTDSAGGGGSGYVYNAVTAKNYPQGCLLDPTMYLTDSFLYDGTKSFVLPTGATGVGNPSDGYSRITVLAFPPSITYFVKVNGVWKKSTKSFVKVNGVWKKSTKSFVKVNGIWKKQK